MDTPESPVIATETPTHRTSLWWVIGVAVASLVFSLVMFAWQVNNDQEQLSGKIIGVATSTVLIVDARGMQTQLLLTETTAIHGKTTALTVGQFVHTFGKRGKPGEFISTEIQIIDRHPKIKDVP